MKSYKVYFKQSHHNRVCVELEADPNKPKERTQSVINRALEQLKTGHIIFSIITTKPEQVERISTHKKIVDLRKDNN